MWKFFIMLAICYIVTVVVLYCVLWGTFSYIEYLLKKKRKSRNTNYFDISKINPNKKYWIIFKKRK